MGVGAGDIVRIRVRVGLAVWLGVEWVVGKENINSPIRNNTMLLCYATIHFIHTKIGGTLISVHPTGTMVFCSTYDGFQYIVR